MATEPLSVSVSWEPSGELTPFSYTGEIQKGVYNIGDLIILFGIVAKSLGFEFLEAKAQISPASHYRHDQYGLIYDGAEELDQEEKKPKRVRLN